MLDKFDYQEPQCPLCSGKDFYNPEKDAPSGRIPVDRIIAKVDSCFNKNDYVQAGRLLEYWRDEAVNLKDKNGELSIQSELVGYYRKTNQKDKALAAIERAIALTEELDQGPLASGATVYLNCATALKAFDMALESMPLYERAEQIYKNVLEPSDTRFAGLYNNMALALCDLERYDEAEKAYLCALGIMEETEGGECDAAITYINMAHMYECTGEIAKIAECMKTAHEKLISDSVIHNGYYAFVCEKCAPSFGYFGYPDICEMLMKTSGEIYERS